MRRNRRASRRSSITSCPSAGGGLGLINDAALISTLPRYALERIRAPTLVMSVADDRFGTYDGARYTAEHVPGARFIGYASRTRGARCDAAPAAPAARSSLRPRPRSPRRLGWRTHGGARELRPLADDGLHRLGLSQLAHVLAIRSDRESLFTLGLLSNAPLTAAVALTVALQLAVIYVPTLNEMFRTEPLSAGELAIAVASSTLVLVAVEIEKCVKRTLSREPSDSPGQRHEALGGAIG
jgi:hypothetical protein